MVIIDLTNPIASRGRGGGGWLAFPEKREEWRKEDGKKEKNYFSNLLHA